MAQRKLENPGTPDWKARYRELAKAVSELSDSAVLVDGQSVPDPKAWDRLDDVASYYDTDDVVPLFPESD